MIEDLAGSGSVTREFLGRRKDGSHIWVLVQIMETRHETATFREGMVIDITDRRRQEQLAQEAVALREVAALAAAAAHEINNPLAVVQGQIELVSDTIPNRWRVEQIRDAVRRIAEIIARMTRITRLEKSVFSPGLSPMLDIRRSSDTKDGDEQA
jgi:signal transduction histidine kinase